METIIDKIRTELKQNIDEKTLATSQHFFKEKIKFYGVKVPAVDKISKENYKLIESKPKSDIFEFCDKKQGCYASHSLTLCH